MELGPCGFKQGRQTVDCYLTERTARWRPRKRKRQRGTNHNPRAGAIVALIWRAMLTAGPGHCWWVSFGARRVAWKRRWLGDAHARKELDVRQFAMGETSLACRPMEVTAGVLDLGRGWGTGGSFRVWPPGAKPRCDVDRGDWVQMSGTCPGTSWSAGHSEQPPASAVLLVSSQPAAGLLSLLQSLLQLSRLEKRRMPLCSCMFRLGRIPLCPCIYMLHLDPRRSRHLSHRLPGASPRLLSHPATRTVIAAAYNSSPIWPVDISPRFWPGILNQAETWRLRDCSRTGDTDSSTALPGTPIHSTGTMLSRCSIKRKGRFYIVVFLLATATGMLR